VKIELDGDNLKEYECAHCGSIHEVTTVNFAGTIRYLCAKCIREILAWI
jgi:DNA-directed RNA polymerase subunit RPC12/RpoP